MLGKYNIEDILDRNEIAVDLALISEQVSGKIVMVTGAAGSIGSEIARQLIKFDIKQLILVDNAETPLYQINYEIGGCVRGVEIVYKLGDVRQKARIQAMLSLYNPDIIFHAAAYKHVPMMENNPCEAVLCNIWGTLNLANCAIENKVERFIMVSSDKAVNPTNIMGASKRIAEMCVQTLNSRGVTKFITTRFGNVLGSNGSVVPLFQHQIMEGGPITITDPNIQRYFMTIPEACRLVLQASAFGAGGEIFIFDMGEQVKIVDIARRMITLSGLDPNKDIVIKYTGLRPGEKLYEELFSVLESSTETNHNKIKVAQSSSFDINILLRNVRLLINHARKVDVESTVVLMKKILPEFKSKNSPYEVYDV